MADITLILGGVRSGKSACAERLATVSGRPKVYLATAEAHDDEMHHRIAMHRMRRGDSWTTLEKPLEIAETIRSPEHAKSVILVDCLTLWLSNIMHHHFDIEVQVAALIDSLNQTQAKLLLVSNEVGQGIVPDNALARQFCDHAGIMNQKVAAVATNVIWVAAGISTAIKGTLS